MGNCGLTEKRMTDGRFRRTERAILIAYYKLKYCPSAKKLARKAGISRATLYRHHRKVQNILVDYEDYLFKNYAKTVRVLLKKNSPHKTLALRSLVFIYSNREAIRVLFKNQRKQLIREMLDHLKPTIVKEWRSPKNLDKMFWVYKEGIVGIIEAWNEHGFDKRELESVLDDILYLTRTAYRNLLSLK